MANLSPSPKLQFFDANGVPLVGGKLYSYAAGTTTPLATYTSSAETTFNTNPIILNSRGEAEVWLGSPQYKFKLTTAADVEIWTVDNIGAPTIVDASVTTAKLADASVTTAKLADASVTTAKLAANIGTPVVLATSTASNSATLDISGVFDDAIYARYELELLNLLPETSDVQALLRVGTGAGPTWQAGSGAYNNALLAWATASQGYPTAISNAIGLSQQPGGGNGVTNPGSGLSGLISFFNPQSTSFVPSFQIDTRQINAVPTVVAVRGASIYAAPTSITGLRFLFSSGNVSSGSIRLLGYRK